RRWTGPARARARWSDGAWIGRRARPAPKTTQAPRGGEGPGFWSSQLSALAELEASARGLLAVLLALLLARVARDVPGGLQLGPQVAVGLHQRARDAVADRTGLRGDATTDDRRVHVVLVEQRDLFERLTDDHARGRTREVILIVAIVDRELALAGSD